MDWFEKEEIQLGKLLDSGEISYEEYQKHLKELNFELRCQAEENAQRAYDETMGYY
jgi:hypothetical protein